MDNPLDQWVVLSLDSSEYALPVQSVIEVLRMVALRPLPEAPPFLAGLLNLRGQGIVVLDLRKRLGLSDKEADLDSQIVIVETKNGPLGLIADEVREIIPLPQSALESAGNLAGTSPMVTALAHFGERLILVLDLDRLVSGEWSNVQSQMSKGKERCL